jgi:hypothetical protein
MKNLFRAASASVAVIWFMSFASAASLSRVSVDALEAPNMVIGKLGMPLGKIVTIEADMVDGGQLSDKALEGVTLLKVRSVDGQSVREPIFLRFSWFETVPPAPLSGRVRLVGYETGAFTGVPAEAFAYIPPVASQSFHFESAFIVLKAM